MAHVEIEVNGRLYAVGCADGQEQRIRELAAYVDARLKEVTGGGRSGSEAQMLVVTSLVLADQLHDLMAGRGIAPPPPSSAPSVDEAEVAAVVNAVAARIEEVAARLERA